jgi:hypothetical protein
MRAPKHFNGGDTGALTQAVTSQIKSCAKRFLTPGRWKVRKDQRSPGTLWMVKRVYLTQCWRPREVQTIQGCQMHSKAALHQRAAAAAAVSMHLSLSVWHISECIQCVHKKEDQRPTWVSSSITFYPIFWEQFLKWTWRLWLAGQLTSEILLLYLCLSRTRVTAVTGIQHYTRLKKNYSHLSKCRIFLFFYI